MMIIEIGFCELENVPLQLENDHPLSGVAVSWTVSPLWYSVWLGDAATEPLPIVETVKV